MIGLIFATKQEARPFLSISQAQLIRTQPFVCYTTDANPELLTVISRIGKVAAAAACQYLIHVHAVDQIINAGACGLLTESHDLIVGQLIRVTTAMEGDHEVFGKRPTPVVCTDLLNLDVSTGRLVTCDRPVFDLHKRHACAKLGELVDMEGAAIARVAELFHIPCELIKGITDKAQPTDRKTLMQNLTLVSQRIADTLWQRLGRTGT